MAKTGKTDLVLAEVHNQIVVLEGIATYLQECSPFSQNKILTMAVEGRRYGKLLCARANEHRSAKLRKLYPSKQ